MKGPLTAVLPCLLAQHVAVSFQNIHCEVEQGSQVFLWKGVERHTVSQMKQKPTKTG